jgi:hypothetical protein
MKEFGMKFRNLFINFLNILSNQPKFRIMFFGKCVLRGW